MKKNILYFIALVICLAFCHEAKAQLVYESYTGGSSSQQSVQTQRVRTTAYCQLRGGGYGKLPIIVEVSNQGANVVQCYQAPQTLVYGGEGKWVNIYPARVSKCYPSYGSNSLEREFMYKANINGTIYYFDL